MSKPATEMRLQRAAEGFTQVLARGNAHIITKNPTTGKCAYDGQVGGGRYRICGCIGGRLNCLPLKIFLGGIINGNSDAPASW